MRTTVTLDPDVERLIGDTMRERVRQLQKFVQKTYSMGDGQEFRCDKSLSIAEAMEDEELSRKLAIEHGAELCSSDAISRASKA